MGNLGSLVVTLEANISKYLSDMQKSSKGTEDAMKRVESAVETGKKALELLGVGVSVGAFAELVKGAIDAADELRDMSQKTGVAVETLNGLGFAARQAGGSLESIGAAAGKVNKSVAEAAGGNRDMIEAYSKLGISVRDASGQLKTADVIIAEVADKFQNYSDGPEKTAIALRIFGKAGADMIPILNDGGDALRENIAYAKQYSGATGALSAASDNFNDTMGKLAIQQKRFANGLAAELLPTLQSVADAVLNVAEKGDAMQSWTVRAADSIKLLTGVAVTGAHVFEVWGIKIAAAAAKAHALSTLDFKAIKVIDSQSLSDLATARDSYVALREEVRNGAPPKSGFGKIVDELETSVTQEGELLATRNAMLNKYSAEGLISQKDYSTARQNALADNIKNMKALYDQEIGVLMVSKHFAKSDPAADAIQSQIDNLYKKKSLLGASKTPAPELRTTGDDPTKALMEGQIKAIEAAYAQERETTSYHDQFMQELRNQDLVDVQTYAQYKVASIEQARDAAVKAYDNEIGALEKARAAAGKDADKAAISNQIAEKVAQRDKARADATRALSMQTLSLSAAQSDLNKQMKEWNIQQDQALSQMQFNNDMYGKSALEVAKLTEARRLELEIEEKIRLAKEKGTITEASIAQYRKDASAHAAKVNQAATQGVANQIADSLRTPEEAENQQFANRIADLKAYQQQSLETWFKGNDLIERENKRHAIAVSEIQSSNNLQALSMASQNASDLYTILKNAGAEKTALGKSLFLAQKAIAIAEILINTEKGASAALGTGPFGIQMATIIRTMGYTSAGIVAGTAIAEASARNGFDIPAGVDPVTQLHEQEMVLPKPQADVIRGLAARGGAGAGPAITYAPVIQIDSRSDQAQVRQLVSNAVQQGNADLVERLQRAGRI